MRQRPIHLPKHRTAPARRTALRSVLLVVLAMVLMPACQRSRSTRLTSHDIMAATDTMRQSLADSRWLAGRTPDSPAMIVVANRVQNLTSDVIPIAEQWMYVARVINALPIRELARQRNVRFVITPERVAALREAGFEVQGPGALEPTHLMTATFLSARRAGRGPGAEVTNLRSDLYSMEYAIFDLSSRRIVWTDRFEFKRQAEGALID